MDDRVLITDRFVFVHVPKTGGDFIRRLCRRRMPKGTIVDTDIPKHAPDGQIPAEYRHLPRFALVRNPWDWHVSWYHYSMGSGFPESHRESVRQRNPLFVSVSEDLTADFGTTIRNLYRPSDELAAEHRRVRRAQEGGGDLLTQHMHQQIGRSQDEGAIVVGKFENLRHDFHDFLNRNSVPLTDRFRVELFKEPPVNQSRRARYQEYYDGDLADLIGTRAAETIDTYGYRYAVDEDESDGGSSR